MLPNDQEKAYSAFYDSARRSEVLDEKTKLLIHLSAAMAVGCIP